MPSQHKIEIALFALIAAAASALAYLLWPAPAREPAKKPKPPAKIAPAQPRLADAVKPYGASSAKPKLLYWLGERPFGFRAELRYQLGTGDLYTLLYTSADGAKRIEIESFSAAQAAAGPVAQLLKGNQPEPAPLGKLYLVNAQNVVLVTRGGQTLVISTFDDPSLGLTPAAASLARSLEPARPEGSHTRGEPQEVVSADRKARP
jgi:hypothetical protein